MASEIINIVVKFLKENVSIDISSSATVSEVKKAVQEKTEIPAGEQKLIFAGRILKDNDTLDSCGMRRQAARLRR
jgi:hypothetical protein